MNTDIELKKIKKENIAKGVGLLALCLVLGPFFFTILHGLGAIAAITTGVGAIWTARKFLPWFGMWVGNRALKAMKAEAMKNPVETLQNQLVQKRASLKTFFEQIRIFTGQINTFADQVEQYRRDGLEDAPTYVEQLRKMRQLLELRKQKYQDAKASTDEFEETIARTNRKWQMALAAEKMNEAAGEIAGDVFDKICIETSLESVQLKLNQSFADLELALLDEDRKPAATQIGKTSVISEASAGESAAPRQKIAVS